MTQTEKSVLQKMETRLTHMEDQLKEFRVVKTFTHYMEVTEKFVDILKENEEFYKKEIDNLKAEIKRINHFNIYTAKN